MAETNATSITKGVHHIGLTVPNLAAARDFFIDTLAFNQVAEKPDYPAVFVSDGVVMITLWQAADPARAVAFDRKNVIGLHHLALQVADGAALNALFDKLQSAPGVTIEFAPEALSNGQPKHMMCSIPGGVRVEFIAPAG